MVFKVTAIWVLVGLLVGLVSILLFTIYGQQLNIGTAYVWSFAFFIVGGLCGFIFGVPKVVANSTLDPNALQNISAITDEASKKAKKNIIQENTNLTQISDWLTKVLIGASLVQLKEIPKFIVSVSRKMAKGIGIDQAAANIDSLTVLSGGIIVYFVTWGFVCGYLVMRLVISALLSEL